MFDAASILQAVSLAVSGWLVLAVHRLSIAVAVIEQQITPTGKGGGR